MKRLFCLVILFVMAFSVAAAETVDLTAMSEDELLKLKDDIDAELPRRADLQEDPITGTWYLSEAVMNGMSMTPSMLNMSITLEFNEDGTLVSTASYAGQDETENDTWAQNGSTITITTEDGSSYDMSLTDGVLALEQEGGVMNFSRENPAESEAAAPAAAGVAAESEDVFLGDWELDSVELMGMRLTKDMFAAAGMTGFTVKLHIEPGKVTMVSRHDRFHVRERHAGPEHSRFGVPPDPDERGRNPRVRYESWRIPDHHLLHGPRGRR